MSCSLGGPRILGGRTIAGHPGRPLTPPAPVSRATTHPKYGHSRGSPLIDRAVTASGTDLHPVVITHSAWPPSRC